MNVTHLCCTNCAQKYEPNRLYNLCEICAKPLFAVYNLERAAKTLTKDSLPTRTSSLWRYAEVLPVESAENRVSLGEGWTPLLRAERLGEKLNFKNLLIKDESLNPTASFK